ncbi:MAG: hypothetical protein MRZ79_10815 [Bacteroidia bacterium]|nr:hypothetical protein [Bacteroidia bacterium]
MKNNRSCPKCKSQEIMIMNKSQSSYLLLPVWPYRPVQYRSFVCTSCGYSEDWIATTKELEKARKMRITYKDKLMAFRRKFNL